MGILFFNWYGYRLLTSWLEARANHQLEALLDNNSYDESQLISIKVPITTLSYYNSSPGFERVDGQIDIAGVHYKYVERRIFQDSIELLCIPNMTAMKLQTAKNEFFRQVNDLQQQSQGKKNTTHSTNNSSKDYCPAAAGIAVPHALALIAPAKGQDIIPHLPSRLAAIAENPPEQL